MIRLTVTTHNGRPLAQPLSAAFDELGGEIGRADTNLLTLPDPDRTISRVHARVLFRNGAYAIVDQGSNPISVNGQPLGKGREAPIQPGDRIEIGGYLLQVEAAQRAGAAPADPFADFPGLGTIPAPLTPMQPPSAAAALDPLAAFGMAAPSPKAAGSSAAAMLFGGSPPAPAPAPSSLGGIPDDWDPFAAPPAPPPSAGLGGGSGARALGLDLGAGAPAPLIPGMGSGASAGAGGGESLDALFGLGTPSSANALFNPLAQSSLGEALSAPNMAGHADPMKALGMLPAASSAALPDDVSELNRPFVAPRSPAPVPAAPAPAMAPPAPQPPLPPASAQPLPGAVMSWDDGAGEGRTIIRAGAKRTAPQAAVPPAAGPAMVMGHAPAPAAAFAPAPTPAPTPAPAPAAPAAMPASHQALHDALREGLGVPDLPLPPLTPELMKLIGQLLHESARGTVDLLVARAAVKREVRAEATMIVAKENNPLKFSPSAEVALAHLLGPTARGFVAPQRAMRDAFDDLRAHQLAFLAGMRAALEGLLQRFDPNALEGRLTQRSMLSTLVPAARRAQLWTVFQQEYQQIAGEVADDFHQVFGREFLRAYEAQLDALQSEPRT